MPEREAVQSDPEVDKCGKATPVEQMRGNSKIGIFVAVTAGTGTIGGDQSPSPHFVNTGWSESLIARDISFMKTRGFVYACSHDTWLEETVRSALSVKKIMPHAERELYISVALLPANKAVLESTFTKVIPLRETIFRHRPRFDACLMTTLDEAVFIDGDTLILQPVDELFRVLDDFDVALCLAPQLHHAKAIDSNLHAFLPPVSMALAEFNAGMIVAKITEKFRSFVMFWTQVFKACLERQYAMDQVALRIALAKSDLRIATLPNNYNFRGNIPQSVAGAVKILHCHGELEEIAEIVNQQDTIRLYAPPTHLIHGMKPRRKEG